LKAIGVPVRIRRVAEAEVMRKLSPAGRDETPKSPCVREARGGLDKPAAGRVGRPGAEDWSVARCAGRPDERRVAQFAVQRRGVDACLSYAQCGAGAPEWAPKLTGSAVTALVVWGTADKAIPLKQAQTLLDAFRVATLLYLESARHPAYLDAPDAWHEGLVEVVDGVGT